MGLSKYVCHHRSFSKCVYIYYWIERLEMSAVWKKLIFKNIGCRNIFNFTNISRNKRYICKILTDRMTSLILFSFLYSLGICNLVTPGNVSPELLVPDHISKPDYYYEYRPPGSTESSTAPEIKTSQDIEQMRETCKLAASILKSCHNIIQVRQYLD